MRIGCCLPGDNIMPKDKEYTWAEVLLYGDKLIMEAGFDYTESNVGACMRLTDEEVALLNEKKKEGLFHLESCNGFLPGSLKICEGGDREEIREYFDKTLKRLSDLGVKVQVFGSGGARAIPENMDRAEAIKEIEKFLILCNEYALKYGVMVVIEPLNTKESNVFTGVKESGIMADKLNLPMIKLLADSYHMFMENESMDAIYEYKNILKHTHIADVPGRVYPGAIGAQQLKDFAKALKDIGYTERVTAECRFPDFTENVKVAGKFMRETFCE